MSKKINNHIIVESLPKDIEFGGSYIIAQSNPNTYTHSFFKYPCRFIPEIPRWAIQKFLTGVQNGSVFDPFAGSGTTLLESVINDFEAYGTEIDNIAKLIIKVKTTPFTKDKLDEIANEFNRIITNIDTSQKPQRLPGINNLNHSQSLQSISYIVSPAVAALLYSVWDLNAIIAIDVLGAVIASITVAIVRIPKLGDRVQSLEPNFIREMKEGIVVLRQNKGLFALLLLGTLYTFVYMPINALFPLISMDYFNGTPVHISITEISFASGMLAGGLLLGRLGSFEKRVLLITSSFFIMGASLAVSGILPPNGFVIFVVCCAIMGLSVPFYSGVQTALFQEKIKPEYLGRVFSLTGSIMSLAMPIGLILSGFFADRIGVNHWFLLSGVLIIGIAIACPMITEVRKLDLKQNS